MEVLKVRPYQMLCLICSFGETGGGPEDEKLKSLLKKIREFPLTPVMLTCNACDVFSYQDPGVEDDTIEGSDFDRMRDLEILHKIDLMPGAILPARLLLFRLFNQIQNVSGICGFSETGTGKWIGCEKAKKGYYEKAIREILPGNPDCFRDFYKVFKEKKVSILPERTEKELDKEKKSSLETMLNGEQIKLSPHILICAVEQYAEGIRPPFENDNLPEMLQHIIKNPDVKIKLVEGADWMMCAPCPVLDKELGACALAVKGGGGLANQLRDLRTLKKLGLKFGDSMRAKDLYKLIFEKIKTTDEICTFEGIYPSVWEDRCGADNRRWTDEGKENMLYKKGREMLMDALTIK